MTTLLEGPQVTNSENPQEWLAEQNVLLAYRESTDFIESLRKEDNARFQRTRREVQLAREKREQEDREQEAIASEIRKENEAEAAAVLAQACTSCFCIHAGEC